MLALFVLIGPRSLLMLQKPKQEAMRANQRIDNMAASYKEVIHAKNGAFQCAIFLPEILFPAFHSEQQGNAD